MASSRMARFVSEVAPPQFVSLMRRRRTKILDTISEDEREFSMNESSSSQAYSAPSHQATSSTNSVHYFKQGAQRKFPRYGNWCIGTILWCRELPFLWIFVHCFCFKTQVYVNALSLDHFFIVFWVVGF